MSEIRFGCGNPDCPDCGPDSANPTTFKLEYVDLPGLTSGFGREAFREAILASLKVKSSPGGQSQDRAAPLQDSAAWTEARKNVAKYLLKVDPATAWNDVVGNEAARSALMEAIEEPVKNADLFAAYGKKPLKGVLLYGPPGCGKTMFGKAAAAAVGRLYGTDAEMIKINATEIQSYYAGETEETIRDIFKFARLYKERHGHPLTIFIDEADAILPSRDGRIAQYEISNVSTFLAEMDGIETSGAFVILATNRPEAIDAALLRDGRCDRKIKVERPDIAAAAAILDKALASVPQDVNDEPDPAEIAADVFDPKHVVRELISQTVNKHGEPVGNRAVYLTLGHIVTGAMLVGIVERAKGYAIRRDAAAGALSGVTAVDVIEAVLATARENVGLEHAAALEEFAAGLATSRAETIRKHSLQ